MGSRCFFFLEQKEAEVSEKCRKAPCFVWDAGAFQKWRYIPYVLSFPIRTSNPAIAARQDFCQSASSTHSLIPLMAPVQNSLVEAGNHTLPVLRARREPGAPPTGASGFLSRYEFRLVSGTERGWVADQVVARAACRVVGILHRGERRTAPNAGAAQAASPQSTGSASSRCCCATPGHAATVHPVMSTTGHSHSEDNRQQDQYCILHCLLFPFRSFSIPSAMQGQSAKRVTLPREPAPPVRRCRTVSLLSIDIGRTFGRVQKIGRTGPYGRTVIICVRRRRQADKGDKQPNQARSTPPQNRGSPRPRGVG